MKPKDTVLLINSDTILFGVSRRLWRGYSLVCEDVIKAIIPMKFSQDLRERL